MTGKEFLEKAIELNLSNSELSRLLGVDKGTITKWIKEEGEVRKQAEIHINLLLELKNGNFDIKEYMKRYNCDPW